MGESYINPELARSNYDFGCYKGEYEACESLISYLESQEQRLLFKVLSTKLSNRSIDTLFADLYNDCTHRTYETYGIECDLGLSDAYSKRAWNKHQTAEVALIIAETQKELGNFEISREWYSKAFSLDQDLFYEEVNIWDFYEGQLFQPDASVVLKQLYSQYSEIDQWSEDLIDNLMDQSMFYDLYYKNLYTYLHQN